MLSLPLYFLLFWIGALPWSPLLVIHRKKLFTAWKPDRTEVYLLLNSALIFLVFTLMATKLPHYTLPAFPFLALLLARRLHETGLSPRLMTKLGWIFGIGFGAMTLLGAPLVLWLNATPSPTGGLVRNACAALTPQTKFALVDFQEPNAIWEMRRVCTAYGEFIPESGVLTYLQQPGPRAVVLSSDAWQRVRDGADPAWKTFEERGWNTAKGWDSAKGSLAFIDLALVVKP